MKSIAAMYNSIVRFITVIIPLYFKAVVLENKSIEGYTFSEVGNLPIVGNDHFKGYELINPKTNRVVYRNIRSWGVIGDRPLAYSLDRYKRITVFFPKNAII